MKPLILTSFVSLGLLACANLPGFVTRDAAGLEENILRTTLDNGLKVVIAEDHSSPVVALNVWVNVGSADERPDEAGMAHVFEHMLFKGTKRRAVGEIARTVEAAGGNINAFTSFDMTVYHITMASRDAATGIDVLADAVQFSTFDPEELLREREVVVEEIRRGEDSPDRALSQGVFSLAYREHPYRLPVIGTEASVRSFTREQMLEFHRRWYVPNNMTFVVVGDIDRDAVLAQLEQAFSDAQPRSDLAHSRAPEGEPDGPRVEILRKDFERTMLGLAFPITRFDDDDTAYLDLLSSVLGGGESSRLYRDVKDRQQLVHAASASAYTPLDAGLFFVDALLEPENVEAALAAIRTEVERMRSFGPSETELERARVNFVAHEIREKETMQGQARKLGYYEALSPGLEFEAEYMGRIRGATPADLKRVAEQYLRFDRASLGVLLPSDVRPELGEADLLAALEYDAQGQTGWTDETLEGGVRRYTLQNGLRVLVRRNDTVPLVALRLSFLGGQLIEDESTQGVNSFMTEMLEKGTEQRSSAQIAAEVEGMAGSLGGFSGRNTFGLTAEFMFEELDPGLELFADVLLHPSFEPSEIEKLRAETLAALKRREDQLAQKAFELLGQALFEGHPYSFTVMGTEQSVQSFDSELLRTTYERYAQPGNAVLSVVGAVDPDSVVEAIALRLSDWSGAGAVELPVRIATPDPDRERVTSIEKGKQQVHVVIGYPGITLADPDEPALSVLTQVLSGQGGRLFLELRDKRSLAYSVTAFSIEGIDPGSFGVYIASAPDKLDESLSGLRAELARLLNEPFDPDEIERAKAYLIGSHAISLQQYSAQAAALSLDELYGLGATRFLHFEQGIDAVTADDLARVARRIIGAHPATVAIIK